MITWTQVTTLALRLPGVELSTSYRRPSVKVRKKMFACCGKQDDHFVLLLSIDEKHALLENHPTMFFQTPHYEKSGAVLVRYETADQDLVEVLLQRAWQQRASTAQRAQFELDLRRRVGCPRD
tara:strand:- start:1417 stop:1785 length:369 start_codon:yes stop_codon:yes gene_type:complete